MPGLLIIDKSSQANFRLTEENILIIKVQYSVGGTTINAEGNSADELRHLLSLAGGADSREALNTLNRTEDLFRMWMTGSRPGRTKNSNDLGTSDPTALPCPFCGQAPMVWSNRFGEHWVSCEGDKCKLSIESFHWRSVAKAIETWNKRATT